VAVRPAPDAEGMSRMARGPSRAAASGERGTPVELWAAKRQLYLDNLKVILVAAIIAGHAIAG
jgi:hypothetical protein